MKTISLLLALVLPLFVPATSHAQETDEAYAKRHERTVVAMDVDLEQSERVLSQSRTLSQKMDYALFLHTFHPQTPERDVIISSILAEISAVSEQESKDTRWGLLWPHLEYDGSDASIIPYIVNGSNFHVFSSSYGLPCPVLLKRPDLLDAALPWWGSSRDGFLPHSGCRFGRGGVDGYPDAVVKGYEDIADEYGLNDYYKVGSGTIRTAVSKSVIYYREYLKLKPFKIEAKGRGWESMAYPFETWSHMSLYNRQFFQKIKKKYNLAHDALAQYYQKNFGMNEKDSAYSAMVGLFISAMGAECGDALPKHSLRRMLIEGADSEIIKAYVESQKHLDILNAESYHKCAQYAEIDPLIHIALKDAAMVSYLWDKAQIASLDQETAVAVDFVMDMNALNHFNKTPLMTAAQYDYVASARFLLSKNAYVNSKTKHPDTDYGEGYGLAHDNRTALMYAAAYASLDMIVLLIDNGAKITLRDSKGLTALDYLEGRGPTGKNTRLSAEDFIKAKALLTPTGF